MSRSVKKGPYVQEVLLKRVQQMNENRKPYAYFIAKLCMSVISALVVYLIARSIISAAFDSIF